MSPISADRAAAKLKELSGRFERKPDGCVYHYTSLAGLTNILASEAIYCSDYRQLNDRTEFHFGMEVLESMVAARAPLLGLSEEHTRKMLEHLCKLREGNFHLSIFCASWCLWPNDLTLWRGYAQLDGVSIGFSVDALSKLAEEQGFACGAARYYDTGKFGAWFDEQLRELSDGLVRMREEENRVRANTLNRPGPVDGIIRAQQHHNIDRWIGEVSSFVKRPDFKGEQEWRCIYVWQEAPMRKQPTIKVRPSGARAIPFIELPLPKGDSIVKKVVIGPSPPCRSEFRSCDATEPSMGL